MKHRRLSPSLPEHPCSVIPYLHLLPCASSRLLLSDMATEDQKTGTCISGCSPSLSLAIFYPAGGVDEYNAKIWFLPTRQIETETLLAGKQLKFQRVSPWWRLPLLSHFPSSFSLAVMQPREEEECLWHRTTEV